MSQENVGIVINDSEDRVLVQELARNLAGPWGSDWREKLRFFLNQKPTWHDVNVVQENPFVLSQDKSRARTILGNDFISPEEVAGARDASYSADQLQQLADTLPNEEQFRWLKDNNYALVAGPPCAMSLLDVRSYEQSLFCIKTGGWYAENQPFAVNEKVGCKWLAICKTEIPNSLNKKWDAQRKLLSKDEQVPNAAEMSWFITTYYEVRGAYLLKGVYVRTSSVTSGGNRVCVGDFGGNGLGVSNYWDVSYSSDLGVSASRKF